MYLLILQRCCWVLFLFICCGQVTAGPGNVAGDATVTSSTQLSKESAPSFATDGIIGLENKSEWVCKGSGVFWGYIEYPWLQLDWDLPQTIDKIILYDRPTLDEHTAGGTLEFSDGSKILVRSIPNDGSAKLVEFESRQVDWVRFQVTDGEGLDLGLSEIEVFPAAKEGVAKTDLVNPFIETTRGRYFYFTPGCTPFGMIAAGPITRNKNQWGGGYNYNSTNILGFGNIHGWMLSGLQFMPTTGSIDPTKWDQGWKSSFSHDSEIAQPGYYRVHLDRYQNWVEISSTRRVSMYRIKHTENAQAQMLFNLGGYLGNSTMTGAEINKVSNHRVEGHFFSAGRMWGGPDRVKIFFAIEFDQPFKSIDGYIEDEILTDIVKMEAPYALTRKDSFTYMGITQSYWNAPVAGFYANYDVEAGETIKVKMAISYTSQENANRNMSTECSHWDFDQIKKSTQDEWNEQLSKIEVKGGSDEQQIKFYTDLWHGLLGRHILDDVDGSYPDYTDGEIDWKFTKAELKVRSLPRNEDGSVKYHMYNSDALWLTQWNLNVLWGLAWPSVLDDFSASMVQYADNGGLLPRGPCAGGYSYIMTGNPATNMLVSAYQKGMLRKVDPDHAFDAMRRNHMPGGMMGDSKEELQFYIDEGWCPGNSGKSLEWAFQDYALSQMAMRMGKTKDYNHFRNRSKTWTKLFRPTQNLVFPKDENGEWLHDDPLSGQGWIEANAWQGTWSISHDIPTLANLIGGNEKLAEKLNYSFEQAADDDFVFGYSSGYVSYANQPGCSNAHVFNHAGKPWLSQYWVRRVNEQAYGGITPERGYGGHDEDQGQMGGVSALMSLGLFSLRGNTSSKPLYELTSPVFDEIEIKLDPTYYEGSRFIIRTHDNSKENMYIQRAKLNDGEWNEFWLLHQDFAKGGVLDLWLGDQPNKNWGIGALPSE